MTEPLSSAEPPSPLSPYVRFDGDDDDNSNNNDSSLQNNHYADGHGRRVAPVSRMLAFSPTTPGQLADVESSFNDDGVDGHSSSSSSSADDHEGVFFLHADSLGGDDSTDNIDVLRTNYVNAESSYVPQSSSRIGIRNLLNLAAFGASLFIHYGIGVWGLNGILPTIREVTASHRTLITPVDWTHWIWAVIYALEGMFVIAQLLPSHRARPVVLQGAGYFFVYSCLAQIAWTMFYSFCMFLVAFIMMATNLVALCFLIISQFVARSRDEGRTEYLLLRFPFSLHVGWVFVETAVNFSILSMHSGWSDGEQLCAAIVSLGSLLLVGSLFLGAQTAKGLVVPAVMIWAFVGIGIALKNPDDSLRNQFDDVIIVGVRRAALSFSVMISAVLAPRLAYIVFDKWFTIRITEL
mmetsp:Transcript_21208/g.43440  ORF Transcript_21208/g.43440 Transcript_21208/m.43440 type:complete len:408 (+) Transcript_21208:119-1342(+)